MRKLESKFLTERIVAALEKEPTLTHIQLRARFHCSKCMLQRIKKKLGILVAYDDYPTEKEVKRVKVLGPPVIFNPYPKYRHKSN